MDRALSPAVGIALLLAVTATTAVAVATVALAVDTPDPAPRASLSLSATADGDRIVLTHRGGDALDVRTLRLAVSVDGEPLDHQPPVPFFAARGFRSGPTGPFNAAGDPRWEAGETGGFGLAGTNAPRIGPGDRVRVSVATEGAVIARPSARG